jgi:alpha-L-fucosidase 2
MKRTELFFLFLVFFLSGLTLNLSAGNIDLPVNQSSDTIFISYPKDLKTEIPRRHEYHQTLTMKLFMSQALFDGKFKRKDNGRSELFLTCEQALEVIKRIDNLSLGIPKIIYLVGWQYNGHDSGYPAWFKGNDAIKRPEDANAIESIKWLMKEAQHYNTTVSLHINMFDAYEDSPLWNDYVKEDIIAKNTDGTLRACEWGYPVSYAQEWKKGFAQKRIDNLCSILPLSVAGTVHIDAFHTWPPKPVSDGKGGYKIDLSEGPVSPYLGFTVHDETEAQRNIFRYWASKGVDVTSEGVDFLRETAFDGYQPMAWWFGGGLKYYLSWPASFYCGGQDNSDWGRLFGTSIHGEDIVRKDPDKLAGFRENFSMKTVIWYYLNRLDRLYVVDSKGLKSVCFSDSVMTTISEGHFKLTQGKILLAEDDNIFIPARWLSNSIIAYSKTGYENRTWALPDEWKGITSVKISRVTDKGNEVTGIRKIIGGQLTLSVGSDEMVLVEACKTKSSVDPTSFKNIWTSAPEHIPDNNSVDAPLLGNGNIMMSIGYRDDCLRFYLSKNDFWRLVSRADNLSGPRIAGYLNIRIEDSGYNSFSAEQTLSNGMTECMIRDSGRNNIEARSWVAATENLAFIELSARGKPVKLKISLEAPGNTQAILRRGSDDNVQWLTRSFSDSVDIKTEVAVALKVEGAEGKEIILKPGDRIVLVLGMESLFANREPLKYVINRIKWINITEIDNLKDKHYYWWNNFWSKSSVFIDDPVLMKSWYQGLYTMASCSRDTRFPPGLFGWTTTDRPSWNGDYHLNYNFQAPFYSLCSSNHPELSVPHDAPLIDFIKRGEWYAANVTKTRGILYPVGIGPVGIEVTRNFPAGDYQKPGDIEYGGLFYGQRSNAGYGLVNMAQYWRCTYDTAYGRKIYPYALDVVNFWEDYLRLEDGRYIIYGDAIHEGSGLDKNPILSLGLIRNAFDLIIDLSTSLNLDESRREKWKDILVNISAFPVQVRDGKEVFRYTEEGVDWVGGNGLGIQHIYPSNAITPDSDPHLLEVARNTVDVMQRWHDMNTSNSFFVAAIRVGYDPVAILRELHMYAQNMNPNSFQRNNPHGIENSCTVTNALNEMFCMSAGNVIRIFGNFPSGINAEFINLRAWGAFLVSARQNDGIISGVRIFSEKGRNCTLVNPWPGRKVQLVRNGTEVVNIDGIRLVFNTSPGESIEIKPL